MTGRRIAGRAPPDPTRGRPVRLDQGLDHPEDADDQEQEPEDVRERREGVLRADQGEDARGDEQDAEERLEPFQTLGEHGHRELLWPGTSGRRSRRRW
jgi:hypothetical protein